MDKVVFDLESWQQDLLSATVKYKGRGALLTTGRGAGKSFINQYLQNWNMIMDNQPVKIQWRRLPGKKIQAFVDGSEPRGLRDNDMDEVQKWVWDCMPTTKRMSFDTWLFKEEKHITMFLMKWTS